MPESDNVHVCATFTFRMAKEGFDMDTFFSQISDLHNHAMDNGMYTGDTKMCIESVSVTTELNPFEDPPVGFVCRSTDDTILFLTNYYTPGHGLVDRIIVFYLYNMKWHAAYVKWAYGKARSNGVISIAVRQNARKAVRNLRTYAKNIRLLGEVMVAEWDTALDAMEESFTDKDVDEYSSKLLDIQESRAVRFSALIDRIIAVG